MLEQPNAYCPYCARPQGDAMTGPGRCERCGGQYAAPIIKTIHEMVAIEKKACQACHRSIAHFAVVCEHCLVVQDPARPPPRPLPPLVQSNLDHRSYEDNYLYVVLGPDTDAPTAEALLSAVQATDLQITDVAEAEYHRGHRPQWEWRFFADNPDRPTRSWESNPEGLKARQGERIHIWLEETGLPLDMGLMPGDLDERNRQRIKDSEWTIGLHCDTTDNPSWNTLLMMRLVRCILPKSRPLVIEAATGRILPEVWREAAEIKPPPLQDCYSVRSIERNGVVWLHTRGLPRWGCFEMETLAVPPEQVDISRQLIDAVAAAMVPMKTLPPPWRVLYFPNGAAFAWVPFEHIADELPVNIPGSLPADRRMLKHATIALVSPYFGRATFEQIYNLPPPPDQTAPPVPDSAVQDASDPVEEANTASPPAPDVAAAPASEASRAAPRTPKSAPIVVDGPNPVLVALSSFLVPGFGQIWLGQTRKGVVMLGVWVLTCGLLGIWHVLAAVDAWTLAGRRFSGHMLGEWEFFWSSPSSQARFEDTQR